MIVNFFENKSNGLDIAPCLRGTTRDFLSCQNLQHVNVTTDIEEFMLSVESNITDSIYTIILTDNSREISDFIAEFIAHKSKGLL